MPQNKIYDFLRPIKLFGNYSFEYFYPPLFVYQKLWFQISRETRELFVKFYFVH